MHAYLIQAGTHGGYYVREIADPNYLSVANHNPIVFAGNYTVCTAYIKARFDEIAAEDAAVAVNDDD